MNARNDDSSVRPELIEGRFQRVILLLLLLISLPAAAKESGVLVLTELPPLYSVAATLAEKTRIDVRNIPSDGRRMNALARTLEKPSSAMKELFKDADAVVTIGKLWREAPLYSAARAENIRVVNIDATEPYSATLPGVALAREPDHAPPWEAARSSGATRPSLYFWLSPSNAVRMAEIIAHDLGRLSPEDASQIERNLEALRRRLFDLKNEYEEKLAQLDQLTLFSLAGEFTYLIADVGLFVDGYFIKQDIDWTAQDLQAFRDYMRQQRVAVVLHKWEPSAPIQDAIRAAGATLVVLRTAEDGVVRDGMLVADGYIEDLRSNLEAIYRAGEAAASRRD